MKHAERRTEKPSPRRTPRAPLRALLPGRRGAVSRRLPRALAGCLLLALALVLSASPALAANTLRFQSQPYEKLIFSSRARIAATLIDEAGAPIEWHAEYATSEALLQEGKGVAAGGDASVPVGGVQSITLAFGRDVNEITGTHEDYGIVHHLKPNTLYYARFVAKTASEEATETYAFTTAAPAAPEILVPVPTESYRHEPENSLKVVGASSPTTASVTTQVETNAAQTHFEFSYSTSKAGPWTPACTGTVTVAEDFADPVCHITGLAPETNYFARVLAVNERGQAEEVESFDTPTDRAQPTDLESRNATSTSAHLTAQIDLHGFEAETHWRFESTTEPANPASWAPVPGAAGTISQAEAEQLAPAPGTPTAPVEAAATGLTPSTDYSFRLFAKNALGEGVVCGRRHDRGSEPLVCEPIATAVPALAANDLTAVETSGPPVATTFAVHALHGESLRLLGSVDPHSLPTSEEQRIAIEGSPSGGTFSLSFEGHSTGAQTTGALTAGSPRITGIPLPLAKGTGDLHKLPVAGTNFVITNFHVISGEFRASQEISGPGLPPTSIARVQGPNVELQHGASEDLTGASLTSAGPLPLTVGELVTGPGIPPGTTVIATNYAEDFTGEVTLSSDATATVASAPLVSQLPYDASAPVVRVALEELLEKESPVSGPLAVSGPNGGPYTVFFSGAYAEQDQPQLACDGSALGGGSSPSCSVTTTQPGGEGADTHFRFQYVSEQQFQAPGGAGGFAQASSTPEVDLGLGRPAGHSTNTLTEYVGADLPALTPGETYRFRLLASSQIGAVDGQEQSLTVPAAPPVEPPAACPNQAARSGPSAHLPDCRAYEQLTPADKEGAQEIFNYGGTVGAEGTTIAADGEHLEYGDHQVVWGATPESGQSPYFFSRSPSGWRLTAATPQPEAGLYLYTPQVFAPDLTQLGLVAHWKTSPSTGSPKFLYKVGPVGGPYATVAEVPPAAAEANNDNTGWVARSANFSKLILTVEDRKLTEPHSTTKSGLDLYEYSAGQLRQANVATSGSTIGACGATMARGREEQLPRKISIDGSANAVSADGRRVFFEAAPGSTCPGSDERERGGPNLNLYMRLDGGTEAAQTLDIGEFKFLEADPAGSTLLLADPEGHLFRYHTETHAAEPIPAGESLTQQRYLYGVIGATQPGRAVIPQGMPAELAGFVKLNSGVITKALFGTAKTIPPQVMRYNSAEHLIQCIACASSFDSEPQLLSFQDAHSAQLGTPSVPFASANGDYAFFDTPSALLPSDIDGEIAPASSEGEHSSEFYSPSSDVYEWRRDGLEGCAHLQGCLSLITSGRGGFLNILLGTAHEGRDVFFSTNESLLPSDNDTAGDIYDARIGGGFPEPRPPVECAGDACSTPFSAPSDVTPSSASFQGAGNVLGASLAEAKPRPKPKARCNAKGGRKCKAKPKKRTGRKARRVARHAKDTGRAGR